MTSISKTCFICKRSESDPFSVITRDSTKITLCQKKCYDVFMSIYEGQKLHVEQLNIDKKKWAQATGKTQYIVTTPKKDTKKK